MEKRKSLIIGIILFVMFLLITYLVINVDLQMIGPNQSQIGLATINQFILNLVGVNLIWYHITDWIGVIAVMIAFVFAIMGFVQLIKRKNLLKVDLDITVLGLFYIIVILVYIFFEINIVNYRPVIIYEGLEASFPSSHTFIVVFIMLTAIILFRKRTKNQVLIGLIQGVSWLIIVITVFGRLISGVHWFTDILAGILLSTSLVFLYSYTISNIKNKREI